MPRRILWLVLTVALPCGCVDPQTKRLNALVDQYLAAGHAEQARLGKAIAQEGPRAVVVVTSRLRDEPYSREATRSKGDYTGASRYTASLLRYFATDPAAKAEVIRRLRPMLTSKSANERGWGNLTLASFPGEVDVEPIADLLHRERHVEVRHAILVRLWNCLNRQDVWEKVKGAPALADAITDQLRPLLDAKDSKTSTMAKCCLERIPTPKTTEIIVAAFRDGKPYAKELINEVKRRQYPHHPAALSLQQQRQIVPYLIQLKLSGQTGADTTTDILMKIPDQRVVPAFFEMLRKHKDNRTIQRQASYSLWIIFSRTPGLEHPPTIRDYKAMNADPMRAGEIWRQWHDRHGKDLTWDATVNRYTLRK